MGGRTSGKLTKASIIGFILDLLFAIQYASGIEITKRITVVINASCNVNMIGDQSSIRIE